MRAAQYSTMVGTLLMGAVVLEAAAISPRGGVTASQAVGLLPKHLHIEEANARRAVRQIYSAPRPQIGDAGLREVIDVVWDSEGYTSPKGAPGKYLDLSFLRKAEQ